MHCMKIYLKEEEVLKMTFICLDATCSPTNQPPTQEPLRDFFYRSQSIEPSRQLCKETDCIQTVPTSGSAVRNLKKRGWKLKFAQFESMSSTIGVWNWWGKKTISLHSLDTFLFF